MLHQQFWRKRDNFTKNLQNGPKNYELAVSKTIENQ